LKTKNEEIYWFALKFSLFRGVATLEGCFFEHFSAKVSNTPVWPCSHPFWVGSKRGRVCLYIYNREVTPPRLKTQRTPSSLGVWGQKREILLIIFEKVAGPPPDPAT